MNKNKEVKNEDILEVIFEGIRDKKGIDIIDIDLTQLQHSMSDHYIVCHGDSSTQVTAIADSITEQVQKHTGVKPIHSDGYEAAEWILLDYANIMIHVFQRPARELYDLESLWADAKINRIEDK